MIPFYVGISYTAELDSIINRIMALRKDLDSMKFITKELETAENILRPLRQDLYVLDQRMRNEFETYCTSLTQDK